MLNLLRADLYRVARGKCVYITLAIFLALITLQTRLPGEGSVGVSFEGMAPEYGTGRVTGAEAGFLFLHDADNIIFYMLAVIFAVAAADFSSGAIKNSLASGVPRTRIYLAKLLLVCGMCFAMFFGGLSYSIILSSAFSGFGTPLTAGYLRSLLKPAALQFLLLVAAMCVGVFIAFATKKGAALNGYYLGFFLGGSLLIAILQSAFSGLDTLIKYDFLFNVQLMAYAGELPRADILRAAGMGTGYIVLATGLGIRGFAKSEIK